MERMISAIQESLKLGYEVTQSNSGSSVYISHGNGVNWAQYMFRRNRATGRVEVVPYGSPAVLSFEIDNYIHNVSDQDWERVTSLVPPRVKEKYVDPLDVPDERTGKSRRQINEEKPHNIPIGTLVEVNTVGVDRGICLHVLQHSRDSKGLPVYGLGLAGRSFVETSFGDQFLWTYSDYYEHDLRVVAERADDVVEAFLSDIAKFDQ